MNKEQFLFRLHGALAALPPETRRELMADYEDHFRSGLEHGKSEEEIAFELGSPEELAQEALEMQPRSDTRSDRPSSARTEASLSDLAFTGAMRNKRSSFSIVRFVMLVFANLIAIPLWAAAWALIAGIAAVVLSLLASPLLLVVDFLLNQDWKIAQFYVALLMLGVGILIAGPFLRLVRFAARSIGRYALWNTRFVMRRIR